MTPHEEMKDAARLLRIPFRRVLIAHANAVPETPQTSVARDMLVNKSHLRTDYKKKVRNMKQAAVRKGISLREYVNKVKENEAHKFHKTALAWLENKATKLKRKNKGTHTLKPKKTSAEKRAAKNKKEKNNG